MKTWSIIILGVSLFVISGYLGQSYLDASSRKLDTYLVSVHSALSRKDWKEASEHIQTFERAWAGTRQSWAVLTHHQEIDNVEQSLTKTREAIISRSYSDARMEMETLRHFIKHIAERERFSPVNIF